MNNTQSTLTFYGGAGTVTGSKYLVETHGRKILLDAGLFQGLKKLRLRNWAPSPFDPAEIYAVVLSHAHIDHSGYLPVLYKRGFRGTIHCTTGTLDLLQIMLPDSAHLQEEEVKTANRYGYSKHKPALPLYTAQDASNVLTLIRGSVYGAQIPVLDCLELKFRRAGHILGSASVDLLIGEKPSSRLVFSGDLGRWDRPILRDPELIPEAGTLLVESTYGDRTHPTNSKERLAQIIRQAAENAGALIVPAFAVGRTQELIWTIRELENEQRIPVLPVYIDSPMAIDATDLYCRHPEDHDIEMARLMDEKTCPLCCKRYSLVRRPDQSKALNDIEGPMIIIAASGMASGGRVLHHLKYRLPDSRTTVLLVGYQAAGTRGRSLQDGASTLRIHGQDVPVNARIERLDGLSGHADQSEILRWLKGFKSPPRMTYIVHGEVRSSSALSLAIARELDWPVTIAQDATRVLI